MSEPKPIYEIHAIEQDNGELTETEPPTAEPPIASAWPNDPALGLDLITLRELAFAAHARVVTILRHLTPLSGVLFLAHFPATDGGPSYERFTA